MWNPRRKLVRTRQDVEFRSDEIKLLTEYFISEKLPSKNGYIDWDIVSEDYHHYILSPFASEMVLNNTDNKSRNLILNYLSSIPADTLQQMDVLDFGCGPGNLIPHIAGKINSLVGLDISQGSINIANKTASTYENIRFKGVCIDIMDLDGTKKYDLIISSNSILPKTRTEVVDIFTKLCECLKPTGQLVAIVPSFDTIIYLISLWELYYNDVFAEENGENKISDVFKQSKLMDETQKSYADDGHNIQCYHTKDSIIEETKNAGLRLIRKPEKVYYPWELTRRFDYGYFPLEKEEIWDWFIVAEHEN